MNENENRSPEEIESDIQRTRADFSSTIEAIQHKLSPSEMMDNAKDYALSTTPGAFSVNLINTIRDNPIPVALIGVGIAWLMRADRRPRYADDARYTRSRRSAYYADMESPYEDEFAAGYGAGVDTGDSEGMMQRAASRTSEAARGIKDKAGEVGQRLSSTASSMTDRLSSTASSMSGRVQQAGQSARSRVQETAQEAQARMSEMSRRSQEQLYRARQRASQMVDEQPLVLGALGIALGAALGATLPRTQRENELMGTVRDDLMERAKETAREQAETVKQSAQRVADVAKQEAGRVKEDLAGGTGGTGGTGNGSAGRSGESSQFGGVSGQQSIH